MRQFKEELYNETFTPRQREEEQQMWDDIVRGFEELDTVKEAKAHRRPRRGEEAEQYRRFASLLAERLQERVDASQFDVVHQPATGLLGVSLLWRESLIQDGKGDASAADRPYIRLTNDGHADAPYFFQLHLSDHPAHRDLCRTLYRAVARERGGRVNKQCWWQYLAPDYADLESDALRPLIAAPDETLLAYLADALTDLASELSEAIDAFHKAAKK